MLIFLFDYTYILLASPRVLGHIRDFSLLSRALNLKPHLQKYIRYIKNSNMTPRLQGQNCKFFKTPLSRNSQKRLEHKENQTKCRKMTRKPQHRTTWKFNFFRSTVKFLSYFSLTFEADMLILKQIQLHKTCTFFVIFVIFIFFLTLLSNHFDPVFFFFFAQIIV